MRWLAPIGRFLRAVWRAPAQSFPARDWRGMGLWILKPLFVLALLSIWLLGLIPDFANPSPPPPIDVEAVYPADVKQLEEQHPDFAAGFPAADLRPWPAVPVDGQLFSFRADSNQLRDLQRGIDGLRAAGPEGRDNPGLLDEALRAFDDADNALSPDADGRSAIDYHRGLALLWKGSHADALRAFTGIDERLDQLKPPTSALARRRVAGVRIASHYGAAIAALRLRDPARAAAELTQARDIAYPRTSEESRGARLAAPKDRTAAFFVTDPRLGLVEVDTADLWSDLLTARIREHASSGDPSKLRADLERLHEIAAPGAEGGASLASLTAALADRPELAVNLQIAAVRIGRLNWVASYAAPAPATEGDEAEARAALSSTLRLLASRRISACGGASGPDAIWRVRKCWSQLAAEEGPQALRKAYRDESARGRLSEDQIRYLQSWRSQLIAVAGRDEAGRLRRDVVKAYDDLLVGSDRRLIREARSPFGLAAGWTIIAGLALLTLAFGVWGFLIGPVYRRMYLSSHRLERRAAASG